MATYQNGTEVKIRGQFFDAADVPKDPDEITLIVQEPDGTETTYTYGAGPDTITKDGTGDYSIFLTLAAEGIYRYRWAGEGNDVVITKEGFMVSRSTSL